MRKARIISLVWCVCLTGMYVYTGDYLFAEMLVFTLALFAAAVLTCIFGGKKLEISLELMEAAKKKQEFKGKAVFYNDSAFPVFYGICHLKWKNTLTGEQGIMKIPFAAAGKRKAEVLFSGNSSFCGDCCFSVEKWECFDFLRIFKRKDREMQPQMW